MPVRLERSSETDDQGQLPIAHPVWGKSGLIFTLVRSDGLIHVPANSAGIYAGERVQVRPL